MTSDVARETLEEMLHCLRGLWAGNYTHDGAHWSFPSATSTPRPVEAEGPPLLYRRATRTCSAWPSRIGAM